MRQIYIIDYLISFMLCMSLLRVPVMNLFAFLKIDISLVYYVVYSILIFLVTLYTFIYYEGKKYEGRAVLSNTKRIAYFILPIIVVLGCFRDGAWAYAKESLFTLFFFSVLPFFFLSLLIKISNLYTIFKKYIYIHFFLGVCVSFLFFSTGQTYGSDAMIATYAIAPPTSYFVYKTIAENKKGHYFVFAVLGTAITFLCGSRGGILLLGISAIVGVVNSEKKISVIITISILLSLLVLYQETNFSFFSKARLLNDFSERSFLSSDSRKNYVYIPVLNAIKDSLLFGWGTFGDRMFVKGHSWSHNIFLEILCDYGLIIFLLFFYYFFKRSYMGIFKYKNNLLIVLFLMSFPQLLVSSSFLQSSYFWIYLGVLFRGDIESVTCGNQEGYN